MAEEIPLLKEGGDVTLWSARGAGVVIKAANKFLQMIVDPPLILTKDDKVWRISLDPKALKDKDDLGGGGGNGGLVGNTIQSATAYCPPPSSGSNSATVAAGSLFAINQATADSYAAGLALYFATVGLVCTDNQTTDGTVFAMEKLSDGRILVGGNFNSFLGVVRIGVALLNEDLTVSPSCWKVGSYTDFSGSKIVYSVCASNDASLVYIVGPNFAQLDTITWGNNSDGDPIRALAQMTSDGGVVNGYPPRHTPTFLPRGFPVNMDATFIYNDPVSDRALMLGPFNKYNTVAEVGCLSLDSTGQNDGTFVPSGWTLPLTFSGSGAINGMISDGAGGGFYVWKCTGMTGQIILCDSAGTLNATFDTYNQAALPGNATPHIGSPDVPYGALLSGGYLYLCGDSSIAPHILFPVSTQRGLLRVNPATGAWDSGWASGGTGTDRAFVSTDKCRSIGAQSTGKIVCGGNFTTFNGAAVGPNLMRTTTTGAWDSTFTAYTNGTVYRVIIEAGDNVLICGDFTTVNGTARGGIARLDPTGALI